MPHVQFETTDIPCPNCGQPLRHFEWGYACSGYSTGECKFGMGYTIAKKEFSDTELRQYLQEMARDKKTELIHGFISKKGKKFDAMLVPTTKGVQFEFPQPKQSSFQCPLCGKPLTIRDWGYSCSGYPNCKFSIGSLCGHRFSDEEIQKLLHGEEIYVTNMKSKKGNEFSAFVSFDPTQERPFSFRWDDTDSQI